MSKLCRRRAIAEWTGLFQGQASFLTFFVAADGVVLGWGLLKLTSKNQQKQQQQQQRRRQQQNDKLKEASK